MLHRCILPFRHPCVSLATDRLSASHSRYVWTNFWSASVSRCVSILRFPFSLRDRSVMQVWFGIWFSKIQLPTGRDTWCNANQTLLLFACYFSHSGCLYEQTSRILPIVHYCFKASTALWSWTWPLPQGSMRKSLTAKPNMKQSGADEWNERYIFDTDYGEILQLRTWSHFQSLMSYSRSFIKQLVCLNSYRNPDILHNLLCIFNVIYEILYASVWAAWTTTTFIFCKLYSYFLAGYKFDAH